MIGQPTFATSFGVIQQYGIYSPSGLGIDASGTLWVGEFYDHRVLGFAKAASLGNGPLATTVLGQTAYNYATRYIPATSSSVSAPRQIVGDNAGNLWVCDSGNHRVLRFRAFRAPDPAVPTLSVTSKRAFTTAAKTAPVRGLATAAAGFQRVEYRTANGKFTPATGTANWRFTAHLRTGPNVFFVLVVDRLGRATVAIKITIRRK